MMPVNLNLMSPAKKAKVEQMVKFLFVKNILEFCVLAASFIAISLTLSWLMLEEEFSNLSASALLVNKNFSNYNQEIREINKLTRQVYTAGKDYAPAYPKLTEIIYIIPLEVKLAYLDANLGNKTIVISGTAKTRDALLKLNDNLQKISWIQKIETPPSQLFQKQNINFEFNIKVK